MFKMDKRSWCEWHVVGWGEKGREERSQRAQQRQVFQGLAGHSKLLRNSKQNFTAQVDF